jgi:hypothetical protein
MADDFKPEKLRHFIYVDEPNDGEQAFFGVMTIYWETDALNAKGQVWRFHVEADGSVEPECSLNTNDNLNTLWCSPEKNLWVGSELGRVWTTANTQWDPSKIQGLDWEGMDPNRTWVAGELPRRANGGSYAVTAIWGSSNRDVYVGTFTGLIFHWDGAQWNISHGENKKPISRMHGTGPTDIWVVGREGLVLHFDGRQWHPVSLPEDASARVTLTGVWVSPEEVYMCSTGGAIFHGSRHGLERVGDYDHSFYGIVEFKGQMFLAAGDSGVAALKGNRLKIVRDTFASTGVYRLTTRLAFVKPIQDEPTIVIHDPGNTSPWMGYSC